MSHARYMDKAERLCDPSSRAPGRELPGPDGGRGKTAAEVRAELTKQGRSGDKLERHHGAQVGAADADVHDVRDALAGVALPAAVADRIHVALRNRDNHPILVDDKDARI